MNPLAEQCLDRAEHDLRRGDDWYGRAADEIIAAKTHDFTLTNEQIGERLGRSESWIRVLVTWRTNPSSSAPTPFGGQADAINERKAKQILREAPVEQIERIVASLPADRQVILGAAVGDAYSVSRREFDAEELALPPAQRKEREAAQGKVSDHVGRAMAGLDTFGIVNHLGQATSILSRMIAEDTLTEEYMLQVDAALSTFLGEYRVAMAKVEEVV